MQPVSITSLRRLAMILAALSLTFADSPIANVVSSSAADSIASTTFLLHESRELPSDLEVSGALVGLPTGATRYISRDELLALPQVTFTVTGDPNFVAGTKISGVGLEELVKRLAAAPGADLVVAVCDDLYGAIYPRDYLAAHHPVLVLTVNGQPPSGWPKDSETHSSDMGPYMISHPSFVPAFKILSHVDEQQIPWGVVRLEFRDERAVLSAIAPRGSHAAEAHVQAGYRIAQQNCLRCHNMGNDGGLKSGVPWMALARFATASPETFAAYIRNPQERNARAQMPGNPGYDAATVGALTAYFKTFAPNEKP